MRPLLVRSKPRLGDSNEPFGGSIQLPVI
jgi:hypothetical protein